MKGVKYQHIFLSYLQSQMLWHVVYHVNSVTQAMLSGSCNMHTVRWWGCACGACVTGFTKDPRLQVHIGVVSDRQH